MLNVFIGAFIALLGTIVTSYFNYRSTKNNNENANRRSEKDNDLKVSLQIKEFEQDLIVANRQYIPNAVKDIMASIVTLYNSSEQLVANYPGTNLKHPELTFKVKITNDHPGVPESYDNLKDLFSNFNKAMTCLDNTISKNMFFVSSNIQKDILTVKKLSENINSQFHGKYDGLSEDKFKNVKKEVISKSINYYLESSVTQDMIEKYEKLKSSKSTLEKNINNYVIETTNIGRKNL